MGNRETEREVQPQDAHRAAGVAGARWQAARTDTIGFILLFIGGILIVPRLGVIGAVLILIGLKMLSQYHGAFAKGYQVAFGWLMLQMATMAGSFLLTPEELQAKLTEALEASQPGTMGMIGAIVILSLCILALMLLTTLPWWFACIGIRELLLRIGERDYAESCNSRRFWLAGGSIGLSFCPALFLAGMPGLLAVWFILIVYVVSYIKVLVLVYQARKKLDGRMAACA